LGGLYVWRKTLLTPMLLHCLQNTFATTMMGLIMLLHVMAPMAGFRSENEKGGGCRVTEVLPGSAAEEGDLRVGDVITKVDGQPVHSFFELRMSWIARWAAESVGDRLAPGQRERPVLEFEILRNGESHTLKIALPAVDDPPPVPAKPDAAPGQAEP
jgi:S1-C subfamily serine protease